MGRNELELDYKGVTTLEDLETGEKVKPDSQKARDDYRLRLDQFLSSIKTGLHERNIFYRLLKMNEPIDTTLRDFLNQRNKLKV